MKFKVFRRAAFARVTIEDKVESYNMKMVREAVHNLVDQGFTNLILDLTAADGDMSKRLLAALAQLMAFARLHDGHCVIVAPRAAFNDFLAVTGLEVFVNIVGSADRALPCLLARMRKRYDQAFFKLLLDRHVVTKAELKEVIEVYRCSGEKQPFGDILLHRGHLTIENLLDLLAVAMKTAPADLEATAGTSVDDGSAPLAAPPPAPTHDEDIEDLTLVPPSAPAVPATPTAAGAPQGRASEFVTKSLFGEILVENGFITEAQLKSALDLQRRRSGARLGDILIEQGYIDNEGVFDALRSQVRRRKAEDEDSAEPFQMRPAAPKSEFVRPSLFGEILLELGLVTEDQLRLALDVQRNEAEGKQLGDILVDMGAVTPQQILQALEEQANRKH